MAAHEGHEVILQALIKAKADVNIADKVQQFCDFLKHVFIDILTVKRHLFQNGNVPYKVAKNEAIKKILIDAKAIIPAAPSPVPVKTPTSPPPPTKSPSKRNSFRISPAELNIQLLMAVHTNDVAQVAEILKQEKSTVAEFINIPDTMKVSLLQGHSIIYLFLFIFHGFPFTL